MPVPKYCKNVQRQGLIITVFYDYCFLRILFIVLNKTMYVILNSAKNMIIRQNWLIIRPVHTYTTSTIIQISK